MYVVVTPKELNFDSASPTEYVLLSSKSNSPS